MKAKKNVARKLRQPDADEPFWSAASWSMLRELIADPGPDIAQGTFVAAFDRLQALAGMGISPGRCLDAGDWEGIAGTIELNLAVMHEAFDVVFEALRRRSKTALEPWQKMPPKE